MRPALITLVIGIVVGVLVGRWAYMPAYPDAACLLRISTLSAPQPLQGSALVATQTRTMPGDERFAKDLEG